MNFKTVIYFLIFLLSAGSVWAQPKISFPAGKEYNLGSMEEGRIYEHSFTIKNSGDEPLEVKALRVGCGCTNIVYPKERVSISPGDAIEAKFTFNSEGIEGETVKYIYVESNDQIESLIKIKLTAQVKRVERQTVERFLSFGLFTVLGAGLIDGINPCAFTVLVFFISFLSLVGYKKKELLILGLTFIASVFLTYILIGLGLFRLIRGLTVFAWLSDFLYLTIAVLTIILGFYSLYDWYNYRKTGDPDKIKLKLPNFIKLKIQKIIQDSSRNRKRTIVQLAAAVFLSGFLVSLLESVCTGQTYLPTIAYVSKMPALRVRGGLYLLLYNLMFILPLAIILIAALKGAGSEGLTKLARKHLGAVKLLTAVLFFLLGILLLWVKKS